MMISIATDTYTDKDADTQTERHSDRRTSFYLECTGSPCVESACDICVRTVNKSN